MRPVETIVLQRTGGGGEAGGVGSEDGEGREGVPVVVPALLPRLVHHADDLLLDPPARSQPVSEKPRSPRLSPAVHTDCGDSSTDGDGQCIIAHLYQSSPFQG